tara:strand:- start:1049 stop:1474 length:426 start_codon:yes stop_codon:yes gene_type:complete
MTELDITRLMKALDNQDNESIMNIDHKKIKSIKNDMLQKIGLSREKLKSYHKSLKMYRYIDELPELRFGSYIRWISLKNPDNITLSNGGLVCDIKVDNGIKIICKNNINRFFQFNMEECLIFQKLSEQEQVILSALDYLNE